MYNCVAICAGEVLDHSDMQAIARYNKAVANRPLEVRFVRVADMREVADEVRKLLRKQRYAFVRLYDCTGRWDGDFFYA